MDRHVSCGVLFYAMYNYVGCGLLLYVYVILVLVLHNYVGCGLLFYIYAILIIVMYYYVYCLNNILHVCHFGWLHLHVKKSYGAQDAMYMWCWTDETTRF